MLNNLDTDKVPDKMSYKISDTQYKILREMLNNKCITTSMLMEILKISERAIRKNIKILKDKGLIERVGSNKVGYWKINNE